MIVAIKSRYPPLFAMREFVDLFQIELARLRSLRIYLANWQLCIAAYNPEWWKVNLSTSTFIKRRASKKRAKQRVVPR